MAPVLTILIGALCAMPWWLEPTTVNHDAGWYLFAAGRLLDGARLFVDVVDVNPPLIIYFSMPPVLVARALGTPEVLTFHCYVLLLAAVSLAATHALLRRAGAVAGPWSRHLLTGVLAFLLIASVGQDFGQREHLAAIHMLPYLGLFSVRAAGMRVSTVAAVAIGLFAGLGLALKPYYLAAPALLAGWTLLRTRSFRSLLSPENVAVVAVHGVYVLHFLFWPADMLDGWWETLDLALDTYVGVQPGSRGELARMLGMPVVWLSVGAAAVVLVPWSRRTRATCAPFALAGLGMLGAALWQGKGWSYHFLPALVFAFASIAMLLLGCTGRKLRPLAAVGTALALAAVMSWHLPNTVEVRRQDTRINKLARDVARIADGGPIVALDTAMIPSFPMLTYMDEAWSSRFNSLWPLPGIYRDRPGNGGGFSYRAMQERTASERYLANAVLEDLRRWPPELVLVRKSPCPKMPPRFAVLEWLRVDPAFRRFWSGYALHASSKQFDFYRRAGD